MVKATVLKSLFVKNVLKVSTGTFLAQLLMLIGMPIITRLYDKEIIGVYALFVSTISITTSFVTLAYDTTIVLPKKDEDANAVLKIALLFSFSFSFLIALILYIPFDFFKEYKSIAVFIAIGTFFQVVVNSLGYFKIRYNLYSRLSTSKVLRNFVLLLFQVGLYYLSSQKGLILGFIIASVGTIFYLIYKDGNIQSGLFKWQNKVALYKNLITYKEYPKYFCWSNLILALSAGLPVIIFNEYFSLTDVAIYSIAFSLIVQPAGLISSSIRPVLLSKLAQRKKNNQPILSIYNKVFYILLLSAIILSGIIFFVLPPIVVLVFGENWTESGNLTRFLIPVFIWYFISIPSSVSLKIYPFQKYAFYYTILCFLITTTSLFLSIMLEGSFNMVVLVFSLTSLFLSFLNYLIVKRKIIKYEKLVFNISENND
ncbi:oligosaccharide flippase family protein [uncultured Aquimarina sp.]|uniref:lipopolysaccharide biosynthesis protein n=1 Tax=uncultured Aquimarina sp. TaxID=575652 RepID=UPI0026016656|nr:oligosaccharide flippase family protein [uncultured Aquimarina sp.]